MTVLKKSIVIAGLLALPLNVALAKPFSLGVKIATLGAGLESTYQVNNLFSIIAAVNGLKMGQSLKARAMTLDGDFRLLSAGASLGIHPLHNGFKFVAGIFYNGNQFDLKGRLTNTVTINGVPYAPDVVGELKSTIHYNRVSPYLGVGFDSSFCSKSPWSLFADLGVFFQGSPKASVRRSNLAGNIPELEEYVKKEVEKSGNSTLLKYFPVISFGVKYVF